MTRFKADTNLFAVVVNWNLPEETITCIHSLLEAGLDERDIILVDNGSTDDSVNRFRNCFNEVVLLPLDRNLGFAGGSNQGIKVALEQNAEWVFLVNNDIVISQRALVNLFDTVFSFPSFEIWTPVIFYYHHPHLIWSAGDQLITGTLFTRPLFTTRKLPRKVPPAIEVDFATGCSLLVHSEVFTRIGLFDSSFFMYGEDVEFCWRARQCGYRIACATRAFVWHKVSQSSATQHKLSQYWRIRNQCRFYKHAVSNRQQWFSMMLLSFVRTFLVASKHVQHGNRSPQFICSLFQAWFEGWFRKTPANSYGNDLFPF